MGVERIREIVKRYLWYEGLDLSDIDVEVEFVMKSKIAIKIFYKKEFLFTMVGSCWEFEPTISRNAPYLVRKIKRLKRVYELKRESEKIKDFLEKEYLLTKEKFKKIRSELWTT